MFEYRRIETDADAEALSHILSVGFGGQPEDSRKWMDRTGHGHIRTLVHDGRIIGGLAHHPLGQWWGGRSVPMTGIGGVAIDPADRAAGGGTWLMNEAVRELHHEGIALSTLYPAKPTLYRRAGYEYAGGHYRIRMKLQELGMNDRALDLRRGTDADFETIERLHRENGRDHNGNTERDEQFWPRVREPWYRKPHVFLVDGDAGPEGYVIYHQKINDHDHPDLWLFDLVARTKGAARRLLTFFRDHRSTCDYVAWNGHPADPLLLQAIEQGHEVRLRDIWMLRLTHVKNALEARGYALGVEGELHLDVADDVCPENGGRIVLHVHGGKAQVEPGGEGRIAIDVRALASIYAGYASPGQIRTAWGLQASDEDLDRLGGLFAGSTPWMQDMF